MTGNQNLYLRCRKQAAQYNERLKSRESAAELLGVSVSSLANYELGVTKQIPPDVVVMMADLYNTPELKAAYCATECPIGQGQPIADAFCSIELATVKLMRLLDEKTLDEAQRKLLDIANDGQVSEKERPVLKELVQYFDEIATVIGELRLLGQKRPEGVNDDG